MKDDGWKTKDEGWRMKNDGWKMKDDGGFVDKQTDRQTDVCDCRLAFATEKSSSKLFKNSYFCAHLH